MQSIHDNWFNNKNFISGIQNAQHLLTQLEDSVKKTCDYETRLLKCKSNHPHSHTSSDCSNYANDKVANSFTDPPAKASRYTVNLAEAWSTMSIVCLQYQYEELSRRYESLLKAYDDRSNAISKRDSSLSRMREMSKSAEAEVSETHRSLLAVGEKYLTLKDKHHAYKTRYARKIAILQRTVHRVVYDAENAREELNAELARHLAAEPDSCRASLLAEIRRCNELMVENIKLKNYLHCFNSGRKQIK